MKTKILPLVSIVIPTYNHANYLSKALQSIVDQTYTNWEAIIIDNHSLDDTEKLINQYSDPRIKYLKVHNFGIIAKSRNEGIRVAKGDWIAFLDSDDYWEKNKIDGSLELENGSLLINTSNTNGTIIVKDNNINNTIPTINLLNSYDEGTIKLYANYSYMSISNSNINMINDISSNIQLNVESNIKCDNIMLKNIDLLSFHENFEEYKKNNNLTGLFSLNNELFYLDKKVILEDSIIDLREKNNLDFKPDEKIKINEIFCTENSSYLLINNNLFKLLNNNSYKLIDYDVNNIKIENSVLIYIKDNNINFVFDNNDKVTLNNILIGGYSGNNIYTYQNNKLEKRNKLGELLVNQVLIIENVLDIICFSDNKIYLKKPNKIIDLFEKPVDNIIINAREYVLESHSFKLEEDSYKKIDLFRYSNNS